ncbi:MAG: oligosaccharide flippase family protein [Pseudomonadota bacterium]
MFFKTYSPGALGVIGSQAVNALAGFVALYCLTNMLSKDDFGAYSFVFSVIIVLSTLATLGLDRTLLLGLASEGDGSTRFMGRSLLLAALGRSLPLAALCALGVWWLAKPLAGAMGSDVAEWWLRALAVAILPMTALSLMRSWFQANHRVLVAAITPGLVNAVRTAFVVLAFFVAAGKPGVALAMIAGASVPAVALLVWSLTASRAGPSRIEGRDMSRGVVYALQRVSETGFNQIDLIFIGMVATDAVTAEFAVAARLAGLSDLGRMAIAPTFLPRARLHLASGAFSQLAAEYRLSQTIATVVALAACLVIMVAGPYVLGLFGGFEGAFVPLLILCATFLLGAMAGPHLPYLTMTGAVIWPALIRLGALGVSAVGLITLVPDTGAVGAAWVIIVAAALMHGAALCTLFLKTGFWAPSPRLAAAGGVGLLGVLCRAVDLVPTPIAACLLLLAAGLLGLALLRRDHQNVAHDAS